MIPLAELETFLAVQALEVDYWYSVDRDRGVGAERFYTDDGIFAIGDQVMRGHGEIAAFYDWRRSLGERTARHVVSNPRLAAASATGATFECIMQLYADDGVPVLPSRPAIMIADVRSECVQCDGRWLFATHVLTPVFIGGVAATVPSRAQLLAAMDGES